MSENNETPFQRQLRLAAERFKTWPDWLLASSGGNANKNHERRKILESIKEWEVKYKTSFTL